MINEEYKAMLGGKSVIRELSEYATSRGAEIGYQNVFDYSLGNPSVPAPKSFTDVMADLYENGDPVAIHGYSPSLGIPSVKDAIAENLNERFGMTYTGNHIFPTTGAAGALSHAMRAVTKPGDEIITFAPYFPEYQPYVKGAGAKLTIVPADTENFQINFDAFEAALNPNVQVVLINTPNNPSGAVYSADTLKRLAAILTAKQAEYGHDIFLISDEPYREIVFDGATQPYPASFYADSLTCYSWSKSLSLPGERIGYVAVNPTATDADLLVPMMGQISRGTGHNCPPSSIQLGVAKVIDQTADLNVYETNMNLLYDALTGIGFDVVRPGGTFYIFPKAL
ncbi:MAG: pyridoxal phosphate-dependent aminotransferase, partial [Bifidobacterium longum]|nr:pyridoxal phosphate-dependent aminotransferase [Bifidobacterium longum]